MENPSSHFGPKPGFAGKLRSVGKHGGGLADKRYKVKTSIFSGDDVVSAGVSSTKDTSWPLQN